MADPLLEFWGSEDSNAEVIAMNQAGMGWLLTLGWLVLGAYLIVLLAVSFVIGAVELVRERFRAFAGSAPLPFKEVDPT